MSGPVLHEKGAAISRSQYPVITKQARLFKQLQESGSIDCFINAIELARTVSLTIVHFWLHIAGKIPAQWRIESGQIFHIAQRKLDLSPFFPGISRIEKSGDRRPFFRVDLDGGLFPATETVADLENDLDFPARGRGRSGEGEKQQGRPKRRKPSLWM